VVRKLQALRCFPTSYVPLIFGVDLHVSVGYALPLTAVETHKSNMHQSAQEMEVSLEYNRQLRRCREEFLP